MKRKIVIWGTQDEDAKVLLGLELLAEENRVDLIIYKEPEATEELSELLMKEWRDQNKSFELPEGYERLERELSVSGSLLPDNIRVEKTDIIQRAQTEWHFIVLSSKLNESYASELSELEKKVDGLTDYDQDAWDSLKEFWSKVRDHAQDKTLLRSHADELKNKINGLFGQLKDMRAIIDAEFKIAAKDNYEKLSGRIGEIETKISGGAAFAAVFEDLKNIQKQFRDAKLTRELRTKIWERLDAAFKVVKEKRFGNRSPQEQLQRRLEGLNKAINKMEQSIGRDEQELSFQQKKIASSNVGQLETQIREAKVKMVNERIRSKKEKLADMNKTLDELNKLKAQQELKLKKDQEVAEARKKADEAKKKADEAKAAAKKAKTEAPAVSLVDEKVAETPKETAKKDPAVAVDVPSETEEVVEAPKAEKVEEPVVAKEPIAAAEKKEEKPKKKKVAKKKEEESEEEE